MTEPPEAGSVSPPLARRVAIVGGIALLLYLLLVLALDTRLGPVRLTLPKVTLLFLLGAFGLRAAIGRAASRGSITPARLLDLGLLSIALLAALLATDLLVSVYLGITAPATDVASLARSDRNTMVGELYPRTYYPSATKNYRVHKPNVAITGSHYGGYYLPDMLRSPTLRDSVLDRRDVTIRINGHGFRDAAAADSCDTFALGDSFAFGWGVTEGATWIDRLEAATGRCVYNLGVNDASPAQELLLLEDVLARPGQRPPRRIIWALYEGNDLEDSYYAGNPAHRDGRLARATRGTIVEAAGDLLRSVRDESLVHHLRTGRIRLASPERRARQAGHYTVDGVPLATPLFHSSTFGYMLVDAPLLDRLSRPESYTAEHAHRRQLDQVFARMRRLADSLGFEVTVLIVPTAPRVYAGSFDLIPAPSAKPYFIDHLTALSRTGGFGVVDLLQEMAPYAESELLYFRDDDHLNPRGHEVVARILSDRLHSNPSPTRSPDTGAPDGS